MAIEEDLSEWEIASTGKMVSYGFGYLFVNYLIGGGFALVFYYYEVEIGLSVALLGLAYVIFAVWNMINDPLLGYLTDRPFRWTKKYGFRAPWVVVSGFPVLIFYFLIWTPPAGAGTLTIFLWFIIMTCIFDTFLSIYNDHVYGGFTNQFPSEYERRRAFAIATLLLGLFLALMGIVGSLTIVYGKPETFVRLVVAMIIALIVYHFIQILGLRESEEMKAMLLRGMEEQKSFVVTTKTAIKQKNFRISLIGYTVSVTSTTLFGASLIYIYKDVYRVPYAYSLIPSIVGISAFLGFIPFWSNYARKHGFKKTYWTCFLLHGLSFIPFLFITDIVMHTIFVFFMYMFYSGEVIMLMPVASDTYDLVATKIGKRVDATMVGIRTFFFRLAFVAVGVIIPVVHILTLYDPDPQAIQTSLAVLGIRIHAALIPAVLYITMGLIFKKYYTLEGAEKEALVKKLKDMGLYR